MTHSFSSFHGTHIIVLIVKCLTFSTNVFRPLRNGLFSTSECSFVSSEVAEIISTLADEMIMSYL